MVSSTLQKSYQNHSDDRYFWFDYMDLLLHKGPVSAFNAAVKDVGCVLAGIGIIGPRPHFNIKDVGVI